MDGWLGGVDQVKKVYAGEGGWDHKAARTRRKAGESRASAATAGELDALGELERTSAVLKTASTLLALSDEAFAKKLETLDKRGPLGQARSRAEVAKAAVDLVNDGTKALHTVLSVRAAKTGNADALRVLRGFEQGDMKRIGQLSAGVGILVSALAILDNPTSKEALEAGVDIAATAGKGTPLAKAKDIYDFGKNAATVLDEDARRSERIDAAMGMIGVAGPLGASLKLTYDGLKALGDLYWGAAEGLVAAGVYPATRRLMLEAQGIGSGIEKLAATARLLEAEVASRAAQGAGADRRDPGHHDRQGNDPADPQRARQERRARQPRQHPDLPRAVPPPPALGRGHRPRAGHAGRDRRDAQCAVDRRQPGPDHPGGGQRDLARRRAGMAGGGGTQGREAQTCRRREAAEARRDAQGHVAIRP